MKVLLDSSVVIAANIAEHPEFDRVNKWLSGKTIYLCPITELAFLRVAGQVYKIPQKTARKVLSEFKKQCEFIACDESALAGAVADKAENTTDFYLGNLAAAHGLKWGTLDGKSVHPAALVL